MLSSNENNKKNDKTLRPLFPKQAAECSYVSCYWCVPLTFIVLGVLYQQNALLWFLFFFSEENVWKLCQDVSSRVPEEMDRCFVVFISNTCRTVPLWKQRAGREDDRLVIWVCT